jgi:UDP-N-acetylmuramoyl-L-alanyl-D-glutamate--2,6-diaminopimelate ligase
MLQAQGFARHKLIVVFGCGGDRDAGKRPMMGKAAALLADEIIITNDNPRTEDPTIITEAIVEGLNQANLKHANWVVMPDRAEAIRHALASARKGDAVLIAGKGHEDYQILGDKRIHFDDREVAREALAR